MCICSEQRGVTATSFNQFDFYGREEASITLVRTKIVTKITRACYFGRVSIDTELLFGFFSN